MGPGVEQLEADEAVEGVDLATEVGEVVGVVVVPEPAEGWDHPVRLGMDGGDALADGAPAAVGPHGAKARLRTRLVGSEAIRVGNLEEAVLERLRPERERLEQQVVRRLASGQLPGHSISPIGALQPSGTALSSGAVVIRPMSES